MSDIADPRYEDPAFIAPGFGGTWLAAGEESGDAAEALMQIALERGIPRERFDDLRGNYTGTLCPDCRSPQFRVVGGFTCDNGHGFGEPSSLLCAGAVAAEVKRVDAQVGYRDTALRSLEQDKQAAIERAKPKAADLGSWAEQGPTEQPKSEQDKQREADLYALGLVIDHDDPTADELEAFSDMRERLQRGRYPLSEKQRAWLHKVCARIGIDPDPRTPAERNRNVPRGREVATPKALQELPKAPPRRRDRY